MFSSSRSARDADDAARRGVDVDELHHRIGPHHVAVDRVLIREHPLATLWLTITTVSLPRRSASVKSRPATIGTPSEAKKPGEMVRNRARGSSSPRHLDVAVAAELEAGPEVAGVAPRHRGADRHAVDARQLRRSGGAPRDRRRASSGRRRFRRETTGTSSASTLRMSKPVGAACSAISVVSSMPAPASSTNEAAICVVANSSQPARRAAGDAQAAARQPQAGRRAGDRQARHERQQHRRGERQAAADPQQAGVDRQVERAHREARGVLRQHRHHRPRAQHAEHGAGAAEQQAFRQQRAAQRAPARAERGANRQLAFAPHRARQDQVGDVRARDDEDQRRGGQEHQQHGAGAAR